MSNHQAICYCCTCQRDIHYLGLPSHRAAHKRRGEDVIIEFSDGRTRQWQYSRLSEAERKEGGESWG